MDKMVNSQNDINSEVGLTYKKQRNFVFYLLTFIIPVICMIVHMIVKECYPFGSNTILCGDANKQYLGFFREWLTQINDGESFLFSWNGGMGYEFYTTYWYYLASPFNWIVLLFGQKYLELGMIVVMLLQVGGCGVTTCYYFIHTKINKMKKGITRGLICVLFSLAFSMCDYILAYQYNMIWLISLLLMPIVLLGIEKLVDSRDGRLYGISLFLVFITNFYFAWFICLFAVVWFIDQKKENIKSGLKSFIHFAGVSVFSAMSAAAVLIPCYLFVLGREDKWITVSDYGIDTFANLGNFFQGFLWDSEINLNGDVLFTNNNYCGIFVLFLVLGYSFNKNIEKKQRIKRIAEIIFIAFSMCWIGTVYIFHGFTLPHAFTSRFAFILLFLMIVTAFEALQVIDAIRIRYILISVLIFVAMIMTVFIFNTSVQSVWCYMLSILIFIYLCICVILLKRKSIKKSSVIINILIIGFVEIITNLFMVSGDAYDISTEKDIYAEEWSSDYQTIETETGELKTAWMSDNNCFQYSDTNNFSSVINSNLLWLFSDLGLTYQNNGGSYAYRGTTPLTAALFNVDYVLTDSKAYFGGYELEEEYTLVSQNSTYGLYKTSYDTELGFMLYGDINDWNLDGENPFEVQNSFTEDVLKQGALFDEINFTDMNIANVNCVINNVTNNSYSYINVGMDYSQYAVIELVIEIPYDMHLYGNFSDDNLAFVHVEIDGEIYLQGSYKSPQTLVDLGELKEGQTIVIDIFNNSSILDEGITYVDFYTYNDETMQESLSVMNEDILVIDTFEDTYVSGTVNAEANGVLYTSIPYYKGWTLYVDGEETEITKIADALVGVELTAGEHTIELKYFPYGLKVGIIINIIGFAGMSIYFLYCIRRKNGIKK